MTKAQIFLALLAVCFLNYSGSPQVKRQSQPQRIPMDLVQLLAQGSRECIRDNYRGSIQRFANDFKSVKANPDYGLNLIVFNAKNEPEDLFSLPAPCFCGATGNCSLYVYQKGGGGGYRLLLNNEELMGTLQLKSTLTNGYPDIVVISNAGGSDLRYVTHKFGVNSYKEAGCYRVLDPGPLGKRQIVTCDDYSIRLFNCDDGCRAYVNGQLVDETRFGEDISSDFIGWLQEGRNQIRFAVINDSGGIAYGIQVTKNGSVLFEKICGRAGQVGCENNRVFPRGVVREFTYTIVKSGLELTGSETTSDSTSPSVENMNPGGAQFTDDFSVQRWGTGRSQAGDTWYQDEEYHMRAIRGGYMVMYSPDKKEYYTKDATVRVGLRSVDGNPPNTGYGLAVHGEKKDNKLEDYGFLIYNGPNPKYKIVQHKGGVETNIVTWTSSSAIRTGTSPNQIEVRIRDLKMDLYINGQFVTSITDSANYKTGRVGFYTSDVGEIVFDDLEIIR